MPCSVLQVYMQIECSYTLYKFKKESLSPLFWLLQVAFASSDSEPLPHVASNIYLPISYFLLWPAPCLPVIYTLRTPVIKVTWIIQHVLPNSASSKVSKILFLQKLILTEFGWLGDTLGKQWINLYVCISVWHAGARRGQICPLELQIQDEPPSGY